MNNPLIISECKEPWLYWWLWLPSPTRKRLRKQHFPEALYLSAVDLKLLWEKETAAPLSDNQWLQLAQTALIWEEDITEENRQEIWRQVCRIASARFVPETNPLQSIGKKSIADFLYQIVVAFQGKTHLLIIDENMGGRSVTNDIENVVADIAEKEKVVPQELTIFYRDSCSMLAGWNPIRKDFYPVRDGYKRLKELFEINPHSWKRL